MSKASSFVKILKDMNMFKINNLKFPIVQDISLKDKIYFKSGHWQWQHGIKHQFFAYNPGKIVFKNNSGKRLKYPVTANEYNGNILNMFANNWGQIFKTLWLVIFWLYFCRWQGPTWWSQLQLSSWQISEARWDSGLDLGCSRLLILLSMSSYQGNEVDCVNGINQYNIEPNNLSFWPKDTFDYSDLIIPMEPL